MTLIGKHPLSQRDFPIGLELSWSPAYASSCSRRCKSYIRSFSDQIMLKFGQRTH
jgi:hypothetical protein